MIHFENLTYTYPLSSTPALSGVTLDIAAGEFVLVAGPSGAGKSTLLRCLNGLAPHFTGGVLSGQLSVAGSDPIAEGPQALSRTVGFVFQDPEAQFVVDRVEDEIAFALENAALPPADMHARVEEVLRLLELTPLRDRPLDTLSGGEKQRVAIAAALAFRPQILALDEPTSQLDSQSAEDVLQSLKRLNRDLGLTIILAEHRLERVLPHVDHLVYLPRHGDSILSGPPRQVLHRIDLTPPLVTLGKAMNWEPLPLTIEEGKSLAAQSHTPNPLPSSIPLTPQFADEHPSDHNSGCRIRDLHFAYDGGAGAPILQGIDLEIAPGEMVALMGRNGSGKTTLLKCIIGLSQAQEGEIRLAGRLLTGRETVDICQKVGYLPQEPDNLLFADTVADELAITLRNHKLLDDPPISPMSLMKCLGLEKLAERYPRDLSVGQRQRVALGAICITKPRLLLLDEPTRGLDYRAKREMVRLLREWQAEGVGILLVTHDVELVASAANRVALLRQGKIIAADTPEKLATSSLFAPQVAQVFPNTNWLTVEDALAERWR